MFWVRIRLGDREYLGVLDTGATISIVAKKSLPSWDLKNIMPTAAIRMGEGHVVHSCGDCEVEVPMGPRSIAHRFYVMDTEAFDFVLGTDFFVEHSEILSLTLQAPYFLQVDHCDGWESVPLEQSEHTSSYLRVCKKVPSTMMVASKTEDYQLLGDVLDQGLKELRYSREDLSVELFARDGQHDVFDATGLVISDGRLRNRGQFILHRSLPSPAILKTQILNFFLHKLAFFQLHAGVAFLRSAQKFFHQAYVIISVMGPQ